ncbi:MAG: MFS transporter [Acidobacteriales bacterium]|nr:MFS transporter [Terriglobales bacterium]
MVRRQFCRRTATDGPVLLASTDKRGWRIVALLFLGILVNYIDRGNLSVAAVPIMRDLGVSPAAMGTLLSAFFWTYTALQLPAGYLVDRLNLKWTYGAAFLLWSLASGAMCFAHSFSQILALRLVLGIGEAVAVPASLAYIRNHFPPEQRGLPTGIYVSGMMFGPALGNFLGGFLLSQLSWRHLFLLTGLGGCFWLLPWLLVAPDREARDPSGSSQTMVTADWKRLLVLPTFWGITLGSFCYSYYWSFFLTWLPSYLVLQRRLSFLRMGAYTALPLVAMAVIAPISGRWADRLNSRSGSSLGTRKTFTCGGFLLGGLVLFIVVVNSPLVLLGILLFSTAGLGLASANYWTITQEFAPPGLIGRFIGYQNMVANLAGICAPALTGFIVDRTKDFNLSLFLAGGALPAAAVAYLALVREADVRAVRSLPFQASLRPD